MPKFAYSKKNRWINLETISSFTETALEHEVEVCWKSGKIDKIYVPNGLEYDVLADLVPETTGAFRLLGEAINLNLDPEVEPRYTYCSYPVVAWKYVGDILYPVVVGKAGSTLSSELALMFLHDKRTDEVVRVDGEDDYWSLADYLEHSTTRREVRAYHAAKTVRSA